MMTAPSTIRPKSSAPRLIRLALIRPCHMPMAVISMAIGMTSAVITAARKFPSSRNSTSDHQQRALGEIRRHRADRGVDELRCGSSTVLTAMPGGRFVGCPRILASTAAATVRLFAPISISAVPTTTSLPLFAGAAGARLARRS